LKFNCRPSVGRAKTSYRADLDTGLLHNTTTALRYSTCGLLSRKSTHPELLEGEVGDDGRVAAAVDRVAVVREQGLLRDRAVHAVRLRVDALHLVEDDALERDIVLQCSCRQSGAKLQELAQRVDTMCSGQPRLGGRQAMMRNLSAK